MCSHFLPLVFPSGFAFGASFLTSALAGLAGVAGAAGFFSSTFV